LVGYVQAILIGKPLWVTNMKCSWVYAIGYQPDPTVSIESMKEVGSSWGSWQTWRACSTDNVICDELGKSRELINRAFQAVCNFYVPRNNYQKLSRPVGLKFYESENNEDIQDIDDIISCHLGSANSDIVLLCGFDFSIDPNITDKMELHRLKNRHGAIRSVIANSSAQWVAIDYDKEIDENYQNLPNFTCDSMESVLNLLV